MNNKEVFTSMFVIPEESNLFYFQHVEISLGNRRYDVVDDKLTADLVR